MLLQRFFRLAYITLLLSTLLVTGCARSSISSSNSQCSFPDSLRAPAPDFICDARYPGFPVTQLVQSDDSSLSVKERSERAVNEQVVAWAEAWSNGWFEANLRPQAQLLLQDYLTENVRVLRSRTSPRGVLWLLVGLAESEADIQQAIEQRMDSL